MQSCANRIMLAAVARITSSSSCSTRSTSSSRRFSADVVVAVVIRSALLQLLVVGGAVLLLLPASAAAAGFVAVTPTAAATTASTTAVTATLNPSSARKHQDRQHQRWRCEQRNRSSASFVAPTTGTRTGNSRVRLFSSPFNPFTSMVSDIASSLFVGKSLQGQPKVDAAVSTIMSDRNWDDVRAALESKMTDDDDNERNFRNNLDKGYGVGSPLHKLRLFDESNTEDQVRVTFFRDSASWCPYCQKVWLALEEKRIPYRVEKVNMSCYGDKPSEFLKLQPSGQIPVAVIDGRVYGQSNDILYALEELFPERKSLMGPPDQRERAQQLLRLERQLFSSWMYWLTSRDDYDKSKRLRRSFEETLSQVEKSLAEKGPFFLGNDVSIVDFMFAPFLERMAASLLYYKGFVMRVPPPTDASSSSSVSSPYRAVNRWFDAMETLPSYQLVKSDYYTHCWDLPPQLVR